MKAMLLRNFEHPEMDCRVLVAGEANVPDLAGFASGNRGFDCAADAEDAVGIFHPDDLMELHKVDHVCLQTPSDCSSCLLYASAVRPSILVMSKTFCLLPSRSAWPMRTSARPSL